MKALLNRQPAMRLGAGPRDFHDIQVRTFDIVRQIMETLHNKNYVLLTTRI